MALPLTALDAVLFGYRLIQQAGAALSEHATLNFTPPLLATNDSVNSRTNVTASTATSGGAGTVPATTPTTVLEADGAGVPTWAKLTDAYVDAAAAIAGTKIAPNFGAQSIVTTGNLSLGSSPATTGDLNVDTAFRLYALSSGAVDTPILSLSASGADVKIVVGGNSATVGDAVIGVPTGQTVALQVAGASVITAGAGAVGLNGTVTIADGYNLILADSGTGYIQWGDGPPAAGSFRATSGWSLVGMDAAVTGEVNLLQWTAGDTIQLGDNDADLDGITIAVPTGVNADISVAGATVLSCGDDQVTLVAATVLYPHADEAIVAGTGITAAMLDRTFLRVRGSGGNVDITANPQIAAGVDGQLLIIQGTDDAATVQFDDGTGLALSASHTLAANDTLTLIYDSGESKWIEISQVTVT